MKSTIKGLELGVREIRGAFFVGPYNKDGRILGSVSEVPLLVRNYHIVVCIALLLPLVKEVLVYLSMILPQRTYQYTRKPGNVDLVDHFGSS